jgi:hypothetical protein
VTHQEPAIVVDAYKDARFHPELDEITQYHTRHIVACPVFDGNGEIVGVVQGMNKLAYNSRSHEWELAGECFGTTELEVLQGYTVKLANMADEKVITCLRSRVFIILLTFFLFGCIDMHTAFGILQGSFKDFKRQLRRKRHSLNVLWKEVFTEYVPGTPLVPHPNELVFKDIPDIEKPKERERLELTVNRMTFDA